jgi:hypothetical protein
MGVGLGSRAGSEERRLATALGLTAVPSEPDTFPNQCRSIGCLIKKSRKAIESICELWLAKFRSALKRLTCRTRNRTLARMIQMVVRLLSPTPTAFNQRSDLTLDNLALRLVIL